MKYRLTTEEVNNKSWICDLLIDETDADNINDAIKYFQEHLIQLHNEDDWDVEVLDRTAEALTNGNYKTDTDRCFAESGEISSDNDGMFDFTLIYVELEF